MFSFLSLFFYTKHDFVLWRKDVSEVMRQTGRVFLGEKIRVPCLICRGPHLSAGFALIMQQHRKLVVCVLSKGKNKKKNPGRLYSSCMLCCKSIFSYYEETE